MRALLVASYKYIQYRALHRQRVGIINRHLSFRMCPHIYNATSANDVGTHIRAHTTLSNFSLRARNSVIDFHEILIYIGVDKPEPKKTRAPRHRKVRRSQIAIGRSRLWISFPQKEGRGSKCSRREHKSAEGDPRYVQDVYM